MAIETPEPGARLGEYIIGDLLAAGGMAEIFHARCTTPGKYDHPIVLKRMHKHLADDRDFVSMFIDEARISTRLDHPNIVQLFDFQAGSEGLYIVLEYIDGPDLLSLLRGAAKRGSPMPSEIAAYITCHVLEALDYAHSMELNDRPLGIVHRDVSPGNVLISKAGRIKLADFGIARANDRQQGTGAGTLKGKYGYMSPEQIEGKKLDGRSDVFSAAIVLAELLMSKRLFISANELDILLMVRSGDLHRLDKHGKHIDSALNSILRKGLARDRNNRYRTAAEFRDDLAGWLASRKERMSTSVLTRYVGELIQGGFVMSSANRGRDGSMVLSGTNTRAVSSAARGAAESARAAFDLGTNVSAMDMTLGAPGVTLITSRPAELEEFEDEYEDITIDEPLSTAEALALGGGSLDMLSPIDLIGSIVADKQTGLLTLERDNIDKQAYFVNGHPVFVASNDPNESFGPFLVLRGVLSEEQLAKAVALKSKFGDKLGQALVGLHLLKPVDAIHLLTEQIAEKLLRCCLWDYGRFVWQEGKRSPHMADDLHLSSYHIVGRGVRFMPELLLSTWIDQRRSMTPNFAVHAPFDAYGFGPSLSQCMRSMTGSRTIGELIDSVARKSIFAMSAATYALMITHSEKSLGLDP